MLLCVKYYNLLRIVLNIYDFYVFIFKSNDTLCVVTNFIIQTNSARTTHHTVHKSNSSRTNGTKNVI